MPTRHQQGDERFAQSGEDSVTRTNSISLSLEQREMSQYRSDQVWGREAEIEDIDNRQSTTAPLVMYS